jgi:hypothetical protein
LNAPRCQPKAAPNGDGNAKSGKTNEEYMELAFSANSLDFLEFFKDEDEQVYNNYIRLNVDNGTLEEFRAMPLVFILCNKPMCCHYIANDYLDQISEN